MDYYNKRCAEYDELCVAPVQRKRIRLCILDHNEHELFELTNVVKADTGTINISYNQGVRRTCALSLVDETGALFPTENSPFWINRKFKIYTGLEAPNGDVYWFSQGVYFTQSVTVANNQLDINGVDKFGFFTGDLNGGVCQGTYKLIRYDLIFGAIDSLLKTPLGNGYLADPIDMYMDPDFYGKVVPYDIVVDEGSYLGDMLIEIATAFAADIYYDADGHLCFFKQISEDFRNYPIEYAFSSHTCEIISSSVSLDYADVVNSVTVWGTNADGRIYRYTETNDCASSPIRSSLIGVKPCAPIESAMCYDYQRCYDYAAYELRRQAINSLALDLTSVNLMHLDVNRLISFQLFEDVRAEQFIIQSITLSLGADTMSISACNITYLPDYYESESISKVEYVLTTSVDYLYRVVNNEYVILERYISAYTYIQLPTNIDSLPVHGVEMGCFMGRNVQRVIVPEGIEVIG